jgi:hypothetical protein
MTVTFGGIDVGVSNKTHTEKFIFVSISAKSANCDGARTILEDLILRNSFARLESEPSDDFTALSLCHIGAVGENQELFLDCAV